jgi:hypothetical protein
MTKAAGAARIAAAFKAAGGPMAAADVFESRLLAANETNAAHIEVGRGKDQRTQ